MTSVIGIAWETMLLNFLESIDLGGSSVSSAESSLQQPLFTTNYCRREILNWLSIWWFEYLVVDYLVVEYLVVEYLVVKYPWWLSIWRLSIWWLSIWWLSIWWLSIWWLSIHGVWVEEAVNGGVVKGMKYDFQGIWTGRGSESQKWFC